MGIKRTSPKIDRLGPDVGKWTWWHKYWSNRRCKRVFWHWDEGAELRPGAYVIHPERIWVGRDVVIRPGTMLMADEYASIFIGDNVLLGPGIKIVVNNHSHNNPNKAIVDQGYEASEDVYIEDGAWIGYDVILLPGVIVGRNAVVGAGSVVTKDVPEGEVWAGNPARCIKKKLLMMRKRTDA